MQTQLHVLPNCEKCINTYFSRHDSVLNSHLKQFSKILKTNSKIYCDSKKLQCNTTSQLFTTLRPDIGILDGYVFKLYIEVKGIQDKYKYLKSQLVQPVPKY